MSNHSAIIDDRHTPTSSTSGLSPSPSRRGRAPVLAADMSSDERRMTVLERNK
jgi:hypothetical protein